MEPQLQRRGHSVRGVANWILDYASAQGVQHTNMGINKLTFFAVESLLLEHSILLTNAKIEAWEHGPVFREIYQSFKNFGNGYITGRARRFSPMTEAFEEVNADFTEAELTALRSAIDPLIHKSAAELRALSHEPGSAWHRVWWYEGHANPGMEISSTLLIEAGQRRQE